ncbi:MAG: glycosyltransferase, partial [Ectothiorhodospiraceae bacterium]|nr:glycosyltransferase [Ectothiorhodospiraceae bacterium]
ERAIPVHGLVVGDGGRKGYAASLAAEAARRRLPVSFLGHRSDLREVMAVSDVVLSLSRRPESFGRTVLEALSLGVPVLGYDHGGVGEILARAWPQGAVPLGDVEAAVDWLVAQHARPERPPACDAFPLSRMLDSTLGLYETLAAERRA